MKIIFLDIDGVLYTSNYYRWLCSKGKAVKDKYGFLFDPDCVKRFNNIIRKTGAKIVISSSWRMSGINTMRKCFSDRGVKGDIIGLTPVSTVDNLFFSRGEEIDDWLMRNGYPDKVAIIDDMAIDDGHTRRNFFKTKMSTGITDKIEKQVIDYLNDI